METEDRIFSLEYFLTLLSFLPLLFFFPQETHSLRPYLFIGIIAGAITVYFSGGRFLSFRKFAVFTASFLILSWAACAVFKSTFFYREVIVICIKSLSLLIVVNGFSSSLEGYLSSMQIYSILLFFCLCALTREYNKYFLILVAGFVFNLSILARIKLGFLFSHSEKARTERQAVNVLLIIVMLLAAFTAWALFLNVPLREIKTWGYLKDEDLAAPEEEQAQEKAKNIVLQDEQIQKELIALTPQLSSTAEMYQALASIQDLLVQQPVYASEVSSAEKNILKMVDNSVVMQGAGNAGELRDSIKVYVDKKILKNLARIKENIGKVIQGSHIGLWQKLAMLSLVNKIEYSSSWRGIDKHSQQLKAALNDEYIPKEASRQLSQLTRQLKEWKSYQAYRQKLGFLTNKINNLNEGVKNDLNDLVQQISNLDKTAESGLIGKKIEKLRGELPLEKTKLIADAQEAFNLKKEMLAFKENSQLRQKLEKTGQILNKPDNFEELLNAVEESGDSKGTAQKIAKLLESMRQEDNFQMPQEAGEMLKARLENLIKESADAIKKQIKESSLADSGKALLEDLKEMLSEHRENKILSAAVKMRKSTEAFYKEGHLAKEASESLIDEVKTMEQLLAMKSELVQQMEKEAGSLSKGSPADYREKISDVLQSSSLENGQKELIDKLTDKLSGAQTVAQVEDALQSFNREISASGKKENTRDVEKIKELMQKAARVKKMFILEQDSYNLRSRIEALKNVLPQQAAVLENNLDQVRESKTKQDLFEKIDVLKESLESKQLENEIEADQSLKAVEGAEQGESLKIYLLPNYAILPLNSTISLRSLATSNNFIKEVGLELEWFSSNPTVAFVNQHGLVTAMGLGRAEITSRYRGVVSGKCKITIVEAIPDPHAARLRNVLGE